MSFKPLLGVFLIIFLCSIVSATNYTITLSPAQTLTGVQKSFYDQSGYYNVLYFTSNPGADDTVHVLQFSGATVLSNLTATLNNTKDFYVGFREPTGVSLLTYSKDSTKKHYINLTQNALNISTSISITTLPTTDNVTNNSNINLFDYDYTKNIGAIQFTNESFYLFLLPLNDRTQLVKRFVGHTDYAVLLDTYNAMHPEDISNARWGTMARNSGLTDWYATIPVKPTEGGGYTVGSLAPWEVGVLDYTNSTLSLVYPCGAYTLQHLQATNVNTSTVYLDEYDQRTFAVIKNTQGYDKIARLDDCLEMITNRETSVDTTDTESNMLFVNRDILVFLYYDIDGAGKYASVCNFVPVDYSTSELKNPICTDYGVGTEGDVPPDYGYYGLDMPFFYQSQSAFKRSGVSDIMAQGNVSSSANVSLSYSEYNYGAKFTCYNELSEFATYFKIKLYSNVTGVLNINTNWTYNSALWGYVIMPELLETAPIRVYTSCVDTSNSTLYNPPRMYLIGLSGNYLVDTYSINNVDGTRYAFSVVNQYTVPISGVKMSIYRFIVAKQAWVVVEQGITDFSGYASFYLEPGALYKLVIESDGYVTINVEFTPGTLNPIQIRLQQQGGETLKLPDFEQVFNDVSYSVAPKVFYNTNATTAQFQVSSNSSMLEYYGMELTRYYNGTTTTLYNVTVNSSPSGGIMNYTTNLTGEYVMQYFFKHENYTEYRPLPVKFFVGVGGSANSAKDLLSTGFLNGWAYYFFALVISMVAAGFALRYAPEASAAAGLLVLWAFTYLYPSGIVVTLGSMGITILLATSFTTLMVIAAFMLKWWG